MAAVTTLFALSTSSSFGQGRPMVVASSGDHLWMILAPREDEQFYQLAHCGSDIPPWHYRVHHALTQEPAAMAAINNAVWLVMPSRRMGERWLRETFTATVHRNAATGLHYTLPSGRLELAPPMNGLGRLASLVATERGPVALIVPTPLAEASGPPSTQGNAQEPVTKPMLLRLDPGASEWKELPLPEAFVGSRHATLGTAGDRLVLVDVIVENPKRLLTWIGEESGEWNASAHPTDARDVLQMVEVAGQAVVVSEGRTDSNMLEFRCVRPSSLLLLGSIERPTTSWAAAGMDDAIVLVSRQEGDDSTRLSIRMLDALTGKATEPELFTPLPLTAGRLWQVALFVGLSLSAVMAIVLLRPRPREAITIERVHVLPLGQRVTAALIDLVIAGVPVMAVMKATPRELLAPPMLATEFNASVPYIAMVVLASAIATGFELFKGASVGKMVVGAQLVSITGDRLAARAILWRGLLRLVVLLIPPLAVLALVTSHLQGLHDVAARALVVRSQSDDDVSRGGDEPAGD